MSPPLTTLKCVLTPKGNLVTAAGRLCYPALFEPVLPKEKTDEKEKKWQASLGFPKAADLKLLADKVEEAAIAKWGPDYKKKYKVRKPLLKMDENPKVGLDADEFPVLIRTTRNLYTKAGARNSPPEVIRGDKVRVTERESEEVYPGRWARVSLNVYTYDHPTGGKGISFGLQNVQLLDHDEPLAQMRPAAETEFEEIEMTGGDNARAVDSLFD